MDKKALNDKLVNMQHGDEQAFADIYVDARAGIFAYIYNITHERALAEDLTQDTFIRIREHADSYKPNTNPMAWILQIAKNLTLNYMRQERRQTAMDEDTVSRLSDEGAAAEEMYADDSLVGIVQQVLSSDEAEIVLLHLVSEMKHREIAEAVGKPIGTVLWSYRNSLKKLKKYLEKEGVK